MIRFEIKEHDIRDCQMVEIFDGDRLLGAIWAQDWGIRVVSKFLNRSGVSIEPSFPPVLEIRLP